MKLATVLGLVVVSAVFCNVHAADFVWDGGAYAGTDTSRYWTLSDNWDPNGQPTAGQSVLVNISDPYAVADADLPGAPVEVAAGGLVLQPNNVTISSPITLSGGTWSVGTPANFFAENHTLNGPLAITADSKMTGVRWALLHLNGALSGDGQITFECDDSYDSRGTIWYFHAADSAFSGPIVIDNNYSIVVAHASRALGTGDITVRSTGSLGIVSTQDYSGATRTPTVYLEGGRIMTGTLHASSPTLQNATIPFNVVVQSQGGTLAGSVPNGWGKNNTYSGSVTLNGPLTLVGTRCDEAVSFTVSGQITGDYPITVNTTDEYNLQYRGQVVLSNPLNSFASLTIQSGYFRAANEGALSTGPITIYNPDALTRFYFDKPTSADWTLTNDITASGPIQVEDGSANYTLNLAGSDLTVGTSSTNATNLSVAGNLAFAKDGAAPAALNIDIIGSGSPLVVTNDRLAVSGSVSGLANANLNISISGLELADVADQLFTIVTSANDLSNQQFASVTCPAGWKATVLYGNGFVEVQLGLPDPNPVLVLTPQSLSFRIRSGEANPTSASVQVQNVGSDTTQWTATVRAPAPSWITLNNATGTDNNSFIVNIRRQGVPVGTHPAYVDVTDANPATSPQTLTVILNTVSILVGDINNDQYVNVGDLQALVAAWASQAGPPPSINWNPDADINADGYVNVGDLQLLVAHWGETTYDPAAPAAVTNLVVDSPTEHSLTLTWTAPGDDGTTGTAASYDIRYRTAGPVTDANWDIATQVTGEPVPAAAGTSQNMVVSGLNSSTTYYFAMKTSDEVPNTSAISNCPSGMTTSGGGGKALLTPRDFKYKGYYVIDSSSGNFDMIEWGQGLTHRYVDGQLRFLTLSYKADQTNPLIEYAPPAGGLGGTISTRTNYWPDIWTGTGLATAGSGTLWRGLWYEEAQNRLWTTWAVNYPGDDEAVFTKSLAIRTLNSNGTVSNVQGPWGLQGIQQRRLYGGVQAIPSWFQATYGVGPYATGWGGCASRASVGPISLGPTFYSFAEPTGYAVGDLPTSAFKTLMDHSDATLASDWYAQGFPTTFDRGVRNCDLRNDEGLGWQSPAPDGLGRWTTTGGDSNYGTGTWIETPTKQGFILIPLFPSGRVWYQSSSPHHERKTAEIQVFDLNMLGQVAQGTRAAWNTYPTHRWQITDDFLPLGHGHGGSGNLPHSAPSAATYDPTTQTLYVLCLLGPNLTNHILVYEVGNGNASVSDVALAETAVSGTVSGFGTGVTGLPGNRGNSETADRVYETITEVVQGSTSQLEHKWTFNVTAGSSVVFNLKSYKTSNSEGDNFVFAYSTNGTHWTNMVTVSRTTDDGSFQTYTMPGGTSGTVYVRVQDSDRVSGHTVLDTIYIDKMYFVSNP